MQFYSTSTLYCVFTAPRQASFHHHLSPLYPPSLPPSNRHTVVHIHGFFLFFPPFRSIPVFRNSRNCLQEAVSEGSSAVSRGLAAAQATLSLAGGPPRSSSLGSCAERAEPRALPCFSFCSLRMYRGQALSWSLTVQIGVAWFWTTSRWNPAASTLLCVFSLVLHRARKSNSENYAEFHCSRMEECMHSLDHDRHFL